MKKLTEKQKQARKQFETNKEELCNQYDYILKTVYWLGGGVMSLYQLKKYVAHFIKKSESTAYRQILALRKGGLIKLEENLGYSYLVIRSYGIEFLLQKECRYTIKATEKLLLKSLYTNQYIIKHQLSNFPNITVLINHLRTETTLLDSKYTDGQILYRYAETSKGKGVISEIFHLSTIQNNREIDFLLQQDKAMLKKQQDRELRKKVEKDVLNETLVGEEKEKWIRDRVEELKVEFLKANSVKVTTKENVEVEFNLNNMNARNIYITKAGYKNKKTQEYTIDISMLDIRKRCSVENLKKDIEAVHGYISNFFEGRIKFNFSVYTSNLSREKMLLKQEQLINQFLKNKHIIGSTTVSFVNLNIEEEILRGATGFRI